MMSHATRFLLALAAAGSLVLATPSAGAAVYTFTQSGFSGGGTISGSFAGEDVDHNGQISSFRGEVSAFSLTFSGDSLVDGFSHGLPELYGLVYNTGDGLLGDDTNDDLEGIASNWNGVTGFDYATGAGPNAPDTGGRVRNLLTNAISTSGELVHVQAVPEPGEWALLAGGLATLALVRRARGRKSR